MTRCTLILALSPLAVIAGMVCSLSFLIRVAMFCLICFLMRLATDGQWVELEDSHE